MQSLHESFFTIEFDFLCYFFKAEIKATSITCKVNVKCELCIRLIVEFISTNEMNRIIV